MKTFATRLLRHVASMLRPALKPSSVTAEALFVWNVGPQPAAFVSGRAGLATGSPLPCFAPVFLSIVACGNPCTSPPVPLLRERGVF